MKPSLKRILPVAEGFARLLHPFAEVVVHDLKKDRVEAIYNSFSKREKGDPSYLDRVDFKTTDMVIGPYEKINWDGRKLKSISIVLRDDTGRADGFLCINVDISAFDSMRALCGEFLTHFAALTEKEQSLFRDDRYEKINQFIQAWCRNNQVRIGGLNKTQRIRLVRALDAEGAFAGPNAADYIARVVGVSRATVYNDLKGGQT